MKCVHCGFELKIDNGYCENCGTEVRVVPDFNALDDEIETALNPNDAIKEDRTKTKISVDDFGETRVIENPFSDDEENDKNIFKRVSIITAAAIVVIALAVALALISNSGSYSSQIKAAQKAYSAGKIDKAIGHYNNALDMAQSVELYEILGDLYVEEEAEEEAISCYYSAIEQGSDRISTYDYLTYYYLKNNDESALNDLIKLAPNENIKNRILDLIPIFPSIGLESGNYTGTTFVEISGSEHNEIYYSLDGSTPDKNTGVLYKEPIELPIGTTTLKVCSYSVASDIYSAVNEADYLVSVDPPSNPVINVASGIYPIGTQITVYCEDKNATIRYTWNGASPNELSAIYTGPLDMPEGENTLRVIAINEYEISSKVVEATYRCGVDEP